MQTFEFNNPLIEHKLSILRNKGTSSDVFRKNIKDITTLLVYELCKNLPTKQIEIETPITKMTTNVIEEQNIIFVPILRAGLGMGEAAIEAIPNAKTYHLGLYRDEKTFEAKHYYSNVKKADKNETVVILDPMLATAASSIYAIEYIKSLNYTDIKMLSILSAPEGIANIKAKYDDVDIYSACIDEKLNEKCYICPGLGDAGDRIFNTL